MELRDYQLETVRRLSEAFQRHRSVMLQLPTGGGKSAIAGAVAERLAKRGRSVLVLVHRRELIDQFAQTLERVGLGGRYGLIAAGRPAAPWAKLQIASVWTLHRRLKGVVSKPSIIVVDEAHHARARTWDDVLNHFPAARVLGMTATPQRLDGKPLGTHFDTLIEGPTIQHLVTHGWLAPTSMKFVGRGILTKGVKRTAGDFSRKDLGERMTRNTVAAPVTAFERHAADRRAVFFGINTKDSQTVCDLLRSRGVRAAHVDANTDAKVRDQLVNEFRTGHVQVLCNVDIISEGTDVPQCDCVMMGLPTLSLTRYLQQAGRAMRPEHGRDALILDLVGNIWRHGPPDEARQWTLHAPEPEPEKRPQPSDRGSMRVCGECATVYPGRRRACPACGAEKPLDTPEHLDVNLITREMDAPMTRSPPNLMKLIRSDLRDLIRSGPTRAGVRAIKERYGRSDRWEQNALQHLDL